MITRLKRKATAWRTSANGGAARSDSDNDCRLRPLSRSGTRLPFAGDYPCCSSSLSSRFKSAINDSRSVTPGL